MSLRMTALVTCAAVPKVYRCTREEMLRQRSQKNQCRLGPRRVNSLASRFRSHSEWPVRRTALQHFDPVVKGSNGPSVADAAVRRMIASIL